MDLCGCWCLETAQQNEKLLILFIAELVFVLCQIISWYRMHAPKVFCLYYNNWAVCIILAFVGHVCVGFIYEFHERKIVTAHVLVLAKNAIQI